MKELLEGIGAGASFPAGLFIDLAREVDDVALDPCWYPLGTCAESSFPDGAKDDIDEGFEFAVLLEVG